MIDVERDGFKRVAVPSAAAALVLMGLLSIYYDDTLLQWQPVSAHASWRGAYAYLSGAVLLSSAVGLCIPSLRSYAALAAAGWIGSWTFLLHAPLVAAQGPSVGTLLGLAETAVMALGLSWLWIEQKPIWWRRASVAPMGLAMIMFGASHIIYASFTASMVPAWMPERLLIAYATGLVHAVAGILILLNYQAAAALVVEASMMTCFVVLLHVPNVISTPRDRLQLTMLAAAALLTSATWIVASGATRGLLRRRPSFDNPRHLHALDEAALPQEFQDALPESNK